MNEPMDESQYEKNIDDTNLDAFERKLAHALRRVDAPSNMQQFLLRAAEVKQESRLPWRERKHRWAFYMPRFPVWAAGALTMVVAGSIFGGAEYRQRLEQERTAEHNFELSQQITDQALAHTRRQLQQAGINLDQ